MGVPAKRACEQLKEAPIETADGLTITADPDARRILVTRDGKQLGSMTEDYFRKEYMKVFRTDRRRKVEA